MGIGKREPITFQNTVRQAEAGGGGTDSWQTVHATWAVVKSLRNFAANQDGKINMQGVMQFREVRQTTSFEPTKTMRIVHTGNNYIITGIDLVTDKVPFYYNITGEIAK